MQTNLRAGGSPSLPPPRAPLGALRRGMALCCPVCGEGRLFASYLKPVDRCAHCGEDMSHHRADDAPPYMTIFIVGHIVVAGVLLLERALTPPSWVHLGIWLPLTVLLSLLVLPRVKGALIGLQWALRMHGFGAPEADEPELSATPVARRP